MKAAICIIATLIAFPVIAKPSWENCKKKVFNDLISMGIREYGNPTAYIGNSGSGAYEEIIKVCGYKPMTKKNCDDIYINAYLSCQKSKSMSSIEMQYLRGYNPKILEYDRFDALCSAKERLTRKEFGNIMCGKK